MLCNVMSKCCHLNINFRMFSSSVYLYFSVGKYSYVCKIHYIFNGQYVLGVELESPSTAIIQTSAF